MGYPISLATAEALYLGLVNDTGNFSHSNVKVETMMMATDLISLGVNNNYIVTNFFKFKLLPNFKNVRTCLNKF